MTLNDANWTVSNGTATLNTPIASLAAGASTTVTVTMKIDANFAGTSLTNVAEISGAKDTNGNPVTDIDSTPDSNPNNDVPNEDDRGTQTIGVTQPTGVFDLALTKSLALGQSSVVTAGSSVKFNITVTNQGNIGATEIQVTDNIPTGMTLNDANWTLSNGKAIRTISSLAAGQSVTLEITMTVNSNFTGTSIMNVAEITGAKDDAGVAVRDIDSSPNNNVQSEDDEGTQIVTVTQGNGGTCSLAIANISLNNCNCSTTATPVTVQISWTAANLPAGQLIEVKAGGVVQTINPATTSSPATVTLSLPAGSTANSVTAAFANGTCQVQQPLSISKDTQAPTLAGVPADVTVNGCSNTGTVPAPPTVTANDNCATNVTVDFKETRVNGTCGYTVFRTWTAIDNCGNKTEKIQKITVGDNTAPTIKVTNPITGGKLNNNDTLTYTCLNAPSLSPNDATITDDCCANSTVIFEDVAAVGGKCSEKGYIVLMHCRWKATDCCGNVSELNVYIKIVDNTPPILLNIPANITVSCDAIPTAATTVKATDDCSDCSKKPFIPMEETTTKSTCAGSYTITRIWTATDDCGNAAKGTQVITVIDNIAPVLTGVPADVTVASAPTPPTVTASDNCSTTPIAVNYTETQAAADGCNVIYTRKWTATDACGNITTKTQKVTVNGAEPQITNADVVAAKCSQANGSATIQVANGASNFTYTWSPNVGTAGATGNIRTNLPAGNYEVTIANSATCFKKVTFTIDNNTNGCNPPPTDCPVVTGVTMTPPPTCHQEQGIKITIATTGGSNVQYSVTGGQTYQANGIFAGLPYGTYNIKVQNGDGTCAIAYPPLTYVAPQVCNTPCDTVLPPPACGNIIPEKTATVGVADCQATTGSYCLPIELTSIANYTLMDNGTIYNNGFKGCDFDSVFSYLYVTVPAQGAQGPYSLNSWTVSGTTHNGAFANIAELVTKMNQWDSAGNWVQDAATKTIKGGNPAKLYGNMSITQPSTGDNALLQLNTQLVPHGVGLTLGLGAHTLIVTDKTTGCKDTVTVNVNKVSPAGCGSIITIKSKIITTSDCSKGATYCISEIPLTETNLYNFTDNSQPITPTPSPCGTTSFLFLTEGIHNLIVVNKQTCCRDTVVIKVVCTTVQTISLTVNQGEGQTIPLHTADLIGRIAGVEKAGGNVAARSSGGEFAGFELNKAAKSVKVTGREAGVEESIFVVCDEEGVCDTTIIRVTVLAPGSSTVPTAVADQARTRIDRPVTVDVKGNDKITGNGGNAERAAGDGTTVKLANKPIHGEVLLNSDATFTYKPEKGYCGNDEFEYKLCNKAGDCNTAKVSVQIMCDNLIVYSGFSPNNDGINDVFTIQGIEEFPNSKLAVFNQAGNEVFKKTGYKNDWDGKFRGADLPTGTYFYMLEDGEGNTFSGYVQINR